MTTVGDGLFQYGGVPVGGYDSTTIGNIYYVFQTTAYLYDSLFERSKRGQYDDGNQRVHNTIASALSACKSLRNDAVIVMPDHLGYTITATLTHGYQMAVKLLCPPAYAGYSCGCNRLAPITMSTTDTPVLTMTGHHCEVAGLTFVNAASDATASGSAISSASATGYYSNIHHNLFEMYTDGATNIPIIGNATDGMTRSQIHNNRFTHYSGASDTIVSIVDIAANSTATSVDDNVFLLGNTTTYTTVIKNLSVKGTVFRNYINAGAAQGGMGAATVTKAITIGTSTMAADNRFGGLTTYLASGGTVDRSWVENYAGLNGGVVQDNDT